MPPLNEVSPARAPGDFLRLALEADSAEARADFARQGLAATDTEADTTFLLLRQLYLAQLESHHFRDAIETAQQMAAIGLMKDIAHHDAARAYSALADIGRAIAEQRLAARSAPPERRSFQYWALASLLQQNGDLEGALGALERAERWATQDRPLICGHQVWIELRLQRAPEDVAGVVRELERSSAGKGVGRLILGMIAYELGDLPRAAVHLRAFLRRNAAVDRVKAIALREELRLARTVLAEIESD